MRPSATGEFAALWPESSGLLPRDFGREVDRLCVLELERSLPQGAEEASGIEQITRAVAEINKVTQQNAANSEESSSAAVELSSQSEQLEAMVRTFQLKGQQPRNDLKRSRTTRGNGIAAAKDSRSAAAGAFRPAST